MKLPFTIFFVLIIALPSQSQSGNPDQYWNNKTHLVPWRMPIPKAPSNLEYIDLDNDGDPDILKTMLNDSIPAIWIDDDDDIKKGDFEGDLDSDCLLLDLNKDGIFAGPHDLSIDWCDEDLDGVADIQLVVQNGSETKRNFFDWSADFMYVIDLDKNKVKHFINWNEFKMRAWEHTGHSNFFEGYHGNTLFLKMHASSFRIGDLRYNWENPFIFYDYDKDGLSEMAIRLVDTPHFRPKEGKDERFNNVDKEIDILFTQKMDYAAMTWDLDNDNGQGNEFDFDMSIRFTGPGFDYSDQVHKYKSLRGLPEADKYFYDARWRQMNELIYPDEKTSWDLIHQKGEWKECRLVFDEDDDCNRWERVEFYDPKDLFIIGGGKGGLDDNRQADAAGDRGEFDMDCSGKGNLYVGKFDGRIHLYGAEWGAWRIDQLASSFQGFGGLYTRSSGRIQTEPQSFATVKYSDTDNNGFFDLLEYDLDGDKKFEETISYKELQLDDKVEIIETSKLKYEDFQNLFKKSTDDLWSRSQDAIEVAKKNGLNPDWYGFWMEPHTLHEKYEYGFWLNFYLYKDLRHLASSRNNKKMMKDLDKAFYSGNWSEVLKNKY